MGVKSLKFKTEAQKVLKLVTHSLYSNKDIFLRELISNASDAIEKLRFESLTNKELLEGREGEDFRIKLYVDKEQKTLTVEDNGIGMSESDMISNLGTIARSGTQAFLEYMQKQKEEGLKESPEFIGQFGVGFYSSFMVSTKVLVHSRKAGEEGGYLWECSGEEKFSIKEKAKEGVGTVITLYLTEEAKDYLEEWKIREIVRKYADYIEFPIVMDVEREEEVDKGDAGGSLDEKDDKEVDEKAKGEEKEPEYKKVVKEETLNSQKAMWLRGKDEIKEEEHEEFYKHLSHDFSKPLKHIHYSAEGTTEFKALIYIPSKRPFDLFTREHPKSNIHLYVKRVFILSNSEYVLPEYLRFVYGVVDSSDLPLNISREHLQEHAILKVIKKSLVNKILNTLIELKEKDANGEYKSFVEEFGSLLKEGVYGDHENREKLLSLLMYYSTKSKESQTSLDEYIGRMGEGHNEIYYISGEDKESLEKMAHLEVFRKKDYEVLYFLEPIDEIMLQYGLEYKGKKFKSISKGDIDLGKGGVDEGMDKDSKEKLEGVLKYIKEELKEEIKEVKLSDRLVESVACLVNDANDMSASLEKIMKAYNKELPKSKRILELNGRHAVVEKMKKIYEADASDARLKDYTYLIYDQALISEGSKVSDPARLCKKISELLVNV